MPMSEEAKGWIWADCDGPDVLREAEVWCGFGEPLTRDMEKTMVETFDFGEALAELRAGMHVARLGWLDEGMWIALQEPDANSYMTLPYLYLTTADGDRVPWLASQTDLLAADWALVGSD